MTPGSLRRRSEQGSATILVLAGVLAGCLVCGLWVGVARAGLARQRAEAAADLAALAAARSLSGSVGSPCAAAATIAAENGGRLVTCRIADETVDVTVTVGSPMPAAAHARAGPATAPAGARPRTAPTRASPGLISDPRAT